MSGDGLGVLVGVCIAVAMLPLIIKAAAVTAAGVGLYKIGEALIDAGNCYKARKAREKKIEANNCSQELKNVYKYISDTVAEQEKSIGDKLSSLGTDFSTQFDPGNFHLSIDTENLDDMVNEAEQAIDIRLKNQITEVTTDCGEKFDTVNREVRASLQSVMETKNSLVDWQKKDADNIRRNKAVADEALRDAQSSLDLLQSLATSYNCRELGEAYNIQLAAMNNLKMAYNNGMYETAFSDAHMIIRKTAETITEFTSEQVRRDYYKTLLQAKLEGMLEEMKSRRTAPISVKTVKDESLTINNVDLASFMQGKYEFFEKGLNKELDELKANNDNAGYDIRLKMRTFDEEWQPTIRRTMERATLQCIGREEKKRTLEVISDFMGEQGFGINWLESPQGDLTQETVVEYQRDNMRISVAVDSGNTIEDATAMSVGTHIVYDDKTEPSEEEQTALRCELNQALRDEGISGAIYCDESTLGNNSKQTVYKNRESVRNKPVVQKV